MDNVKHNGYANYDTWKLCVHIDNYRPNYNRVKAVKKILLNAKKAPLIRWLKKYIVLQNDTVNWNNIVIKDVKQIIREM